MWTLDNYGRLSSSPWYCKFLSTSLLLDIDTAIPITWGGGSVFLLPKNRFFGYWIEEGQIKKKLVWLWGKGCIDIMDCLKPIFPLSLTWLLDLTPNIHGQLWPSSVNNQVMPMYIATFAYIYIEVTTLINYTL
jgi:hypothetical protein